MEISTFLERISTLLAFAMLLIALNISASPTVKLMLTSYQVQAWLLAVVVFLSAAEFPPIRFNLTIASVGILPIFLALSIRYFLRRATLAGPEIPDATPKTEDSTEHMLDTAVRNAELIWMQHGRSRRSGVASISIDLTLTIIAFLVAYRLGSTSQAGRIDTNSLAVSLALLLLGIFTMSNKRDIIAQIIGLLVMEHGLFLAAVKIITFPELAIVFVVSLFFYITITLTILLYLLPAMHRISGSIKLDEQQQLRG